MRRPRDSRLKIKRGGGRSFNRDFRGPEEDDNPFSLDNTNDRAGAESSDSDSDDDDDDDRQSGAESDESDGFGGKINKKSAANTAEDDAREADEMTKSMGTASLAAQHAPTTATTTTKQPQAQAGSGGKGLGERRAVKSAEEIAQARQAKKVEKKPTTGDNPKNLNKGAPVQMSRREREEKEKAAARERYAALHAAGKTDEAKKDMARLAAIRKQREAQKAAKDKEAADKEAARVAGLAKSGRKITK